jgi:hypothetical protein
VHGTAGTSHAAAGPVPEARRVSFAPTTLAHGRFSARWTPEPAADAALAVSALADGHGAVSTLGADSPCRLLRSVFTASPPAAAFVTAGRGGDFPTPSSPLSIASDDSADLDAVTDAVLPRADARVTAIRDHLRAQGLQDAATDHLWILLHN